MPFRLVNVRVTFQRLLLYVLGKLQYQTAFDNLDDTIVSSRRVREESTPFSGNICRECLWFTP